MRRVPKSALGINHKLKQENNIRCYLQNSTNLRRKEMKKNEVCKKRKTKVASEDNAYLQVLTIKENAQTELAKDSSTSAVTMKDSLQRKMQPYLFVPMLQCRTLSSLQETKNLSWLWNYSTDSSLSTEPSHSEV